MTPPAPEPRKYLTEKQKAEVWLACGGKCSWCGKKIMPGEPYQWDHLVALIFGGSNDLSNWGPKHTETCHREKSIAEHKANSKGKRIRAKNAGTFKTKGPKLRSRGFPKCYRPLRNPNWKPLIGGGAVRRVD